MGTICLGADMKLFRTIASHDGSVTVSQLAKTTQASPLMLGKSCCYIFDVKDQKNNIGSLLKRDYSGIWARTA
jgi:hypothetical protein